MRGEEKLCLHVKSAQVTSGGYETLTCIYFYILNSLLIVSMATGGYYFHILTGSVDSVSCHSKLM